MHPNKAKCLPKKQKMTSKEDNVIKTKIVLD